MSLKISSAKWRPFRLDINVNCNIKPAPEQHRDLFNIKIPPYRYSNCYYKDKMFFIQSYLLSWKSRYPDSPLNWIATMNPVICSCIGKASHLNRQPTLKTPGSQWVKASVTASLKHHNLAVPWNKTLRRCCLVVYSDALYSSCCRDNRY